MILMGPTGNLICGHVLDVSKKPFEETLKFYDPQLYVKWNPKKCRGWGAWEIRRKPETYSCLDISQFQDNLIFKLGLREIDLVHNVLDAAFLNYDQLRRLQEMDTFKYGGSAQWQRTMESRIAEREIAKKEAGLKLRREAARTFKNEIRAFKQFILDGGNPHLISNYWEKVKALE